MKEQVSLRSYFSLFLGAYYFFYFALVGVYIIFIPKTLFDLHYTSAEIGIIYAAAPFMRFLLPFIFRHWLALNAHIYMWSLFFTLITSLGLLYTIETFWFYLIANIFFGAAMGVSLPYIETIALSTLSKSHYGKVRLWGSLGFMGIALLLGKVLENPLDTLYYLVVMAFFTVFFALFLLQYEHDSEEDIHSEQHFTLSRYWAFWVSIFLMQVGFGGFYSFFTVYEMAQGVSLEMTTWMWSFGVICEIVMLYFQAPLLQRNLLHILQFATLVTVIRWLILYAYPSSIVLTFTSQSLHAISFALYHTASITYVFSLYRQKKLAQQFFLGIAFGLGGSVGAFIAGKVYGEALFLIEAVITFAAFVILLIHQKCIRDMSYV